MTDQPAQSPDAAGSAAPANFVQRVGRIQDRAMQESSGIVASRTQPNVFWTHNDRGNRARIFALTRDGAVLGEYRIDARNHDWEDIAADAEGHLYLGDIGDNAEGRRGMEVLRIREPKASAALPRPGGRIQVERRWRIQYPGRRFDCESLFVEGQRGYLISKVGRGDVAAIYQFPLDGGENVTLETVASLPIRAPVTGADLSADGKWLAVVSEAGLHLFPIAGDITRASRLTPEFIRLPNLQFEAVCFAAKGVLLTAESREIFFYELK